MTDLLPCPFCGCANASIVEGSTFRWAHLECDSCSARGPEIRVDTMATLLEQKLKAEKDATAAWNERKP